MSRIAILVIICAIFQATKLQAQQTKPDKQSIGKRWSVTFSAGTTKGGPASGIEKEMISSGFNKTSPASCFFILCVEERKHPHSDDSGGAWWGEAKYYFSNPFAVSLKYSSGSLSGTNGYHREAGFLFIENSYKSISTIISANIYDILKFGIGPSLYFVDIEDVSSSGIENKKNSTKLGLSLDMALRIPQKSRFFVEFNLQLNRGGNIEIGPFVKESLSGGQVSFPNTEVKFNYTNIGFGIGLRI